MPHRVMVVHGRPVERGAPVLARCAMGIGAALQQLHHHRLVAKKGAADERRDALCIRCIHRRPSRQQRLHSIHSTKLSLTLLDPNPSSVHQYQPYVIHVHLACALSRIPSHPVGTMYLLRSFDA